MILDEKPPPPYSNDRAAPPATGWRTAAALPPHLLLQIVYSTFSDASDVAEQRKTLYWISRGLRLVNRLLYTTSMNVLRSLYLPVYESLIRRPYTSDPFPHTDAHTLRSNSPLASLQRETAIFDMFIALKVREDVWSDDSELHLERDDSFADLFNLMQPRSRLEDLFRDSAVEEGVVYIDHQRRGTPASFGAKSKATTPVPPPPPMKVTITPLPFSALAITFSSRRVGLLLSVPGRMTSSKRTVVEVQRSKDEPLEVAARRLVWALRDYIVEEADGQLYD
ncbi:hypothetical protein C8F01DRAFT_992598 [Mycena amicta]|nr:hypothetical protein C8F01DRAFT_992598 [Mycena amicta]